MGSIWVGEGRAVGVWVGVVTERSFMLARKGGQRKKERKMERKEINSVSKQE